MKNISLDYSYTYPFIDDKKINSYLDTAFKAMDMLLNRTGRGKDSLGWLDLPEKTLSSGLIGEIEKVSDEIYNNADLLICTGIGGSYLGAKAVTDALLHPFYNSLPKNERKGPKLIFAGQNISGIWLEAVINEINTNKSVYVNVISKSGTTTEPGIAFRLIKQQIEKKYGKKESAKRIIATTDANEGALKSLSDKEGYRTFVIPDDVGGRYSVLTPVGLLPISSAGISINELLQGAKDASEFGKIRNIKNNPGLLYALLRNLLLKQGYHTEILINYEPTLHYINEWWKQLFGESEGKNNKGIFPASVDFTSDLHSMGQWIQEGQRFIFGTTLNIMGADSDLKVPSDEGSPDELEYLAGKSYFEINQQAFRGTVVAHHDGGVPNIIFNVPELNEYYLGQLLYIFEEACGISGYLLEVNPFDQPGVESYKKNMFALLNKPGEQNKINRKKIDEKISKIPKDKVTE
ncbi:MAG: glucose-6-phosphate isomerase [Spirochaetes bacterium]|nr:glucose-6-phosphate isomerase [Spirochaetota bacterium]